MVLFVQILHKRAIAASDEVRTTPDLRTGDIVEIRLVLTLFFFFFFQINMFKKGHKLI